MNYIQQVNGFWAKAETDDLTGNDIAVYFAILKYCNSLNWLNPFICHWHIICQYSKVSKNTYYKCVERLNNLNYIVFKKGERSKSMPKITVLEFENKKGTIKEQEGNTEGIKREQEGNLYKLLNNKTIKLINENSKLVNEKIEKWINSETSNSLSKKLNRDIESRFSSDVLNCYYNCLGFFPNDIHPKKGSKKEDSWVSTIEKLNRIDKLEFSDIESIVRLARRDSFWEENFLSLTKLRTQNKDKLPYWKVFAIKFKNNYKNERFIDLASQLRENNPDL